MASVESLVESMSNIQNDLADQRGINSKLDQQLSQSEQNARELKMLITGPDGSSGLLARIAGLEVRLEQTSAEVRKLQQIFADTRATLFKLSLLVAVSASAGTAGVSKLISILGF